MRALIAGCATVLAALCISHAHGAPEPVTLRIAAATDLQRVLGAVLRRFNEVEPGIRTEISYAASGTLFAQIVNGAPFDVFLSADEQYPQKLIEQGSATSETLFRYARGQLAVIARKPLPEEGTLLFLARSDAQRIAIANPRHAPYGCAAEAALRSANAYDAISPRLVLAENVAQADQMVRSGAADAGIVALANALYTSGTVVVVPIPETYYPPIIQAGVVISSSKNQPAAGKLVRFLTGAEGKALLEQGGLRAE